MTSGPYLRPLGLSSAAPVADVSRSLCGQGLTFNALEIASRNSSGSVERQVVALGDLLAAGDPALDAGLARLTTPRAAFAGLDLSRPQVMGVINVTPDSFSDGGDHLDSARAIDQGLAMAAAGAALLDVGGESTRPGAAPVPVEEELRRVLPVIKGLVAQGAKVSIDSRRAQIMAEALAAGAQIVNDVTALTGDPDSLALVARARVPVILMHMQGEPQTMQTAPHYDDVALDIFDWLAERVAVCEAAGISRGAIAVDPGIGFGKTLAHNLSLLDRLALFHGLGCPLVLGVSRKSFIGRVAGEEAPKNRLPGSLAAALAGVVRGAQILRVHDVAETRQALDIWQAIVAGEPAAIAAI